MDCYENIADCYIDRLKMSYSPEGFVDYIEGLNWEREKYESECKSISS